jgi:hypothetical protein
MTWLTPFKGCFGHRAYAVSLGHYVAGLLSDSPRKAIPAHTMVAPLRYGE